MRALAPDAPSAPPALALSGGGDSVALMHLLGGWLRTHKRAPGHALIVDHGLRPESAAEAARAASWARAAGWRAHVLRRCGESPKSNIEAEARAARYRLMGEWCLAHKTTRLFLAHTRDDLAENFLLRLGRGSGVDGLSAMPCRGAFPLPGFAGVELVRPLLDFGRDELRAYLRRRAIAWIDDPMNDDSRFFRARVRALIPALAAAGIPAGRIAAASRHLARAREALEAGTRSFIAEFARPESGGRVLLDRGALAGAPREVGLRAFGALLMIVSSSSYRPRFDSLEAAYDAVTAGRPVRGRTLHGCRIGAAPRRFQVFGPATLEIRREGARKPARGEKTAP